MAKHQGQAMQYWQLEAVISIYLLILALLCVHNPDNWSLLAAALLVLAPIKIIPMWYKTGQIFVAASHEGDISDLIIELGREGFEPKGVGAREYIFKRSLYLFPASWCMVKHDGSRNILVGTNHLMTSLRSRGVEIELI